MDATEPGNTQPQPTHWWGRNWKWFVPTGCLAMLLLVAAFVAFIIAIVFGAMKSSDVYKTALARAKTDPRVIAALGSPIEAGFFVSGKTNVSGSSGNADLTIPISGPKGKGTIYFVASKFAGEWTFSKLVVDLEKTGQRIDLTTQEDAGTEP
jgi:hypothetical protein